MRENRRPRLGRAAAAGCVLATLVIAFFNTAGCRNSPAATLRPANPTYASTGAQACRVVENRGEPFVIDWRPEQRADLEIAMRDKVAIVHYDCGSLHLLKDCSAQGDYGFVGITRKEQLVRIADEDELRANFPFGGPALATRLSMELQRGTSLDVALVMVGKRTTTREKLGRPELRGTCEAATHYVRRATLGAFAMETGARAETRSVAQVFLGGTSGASTSISQVRNQDGSLTSCSDSSPDSTQPPSQCGAVLRIELSAIDEPPATVPSPATCRSGMVVAEGRCVVASEGRAHRCKYEFADCKRQCNAGNSSSCSDLGMLYQTGQGTEVDLSRSIESYRRACDDDDIEGCAHLGTAYGLGTGVQPNLHRASELLHKACERGLATACSNLGSIKDREKDIVGATTLYERACNGGDALGCTNVGFKRLEARDFESARKFFERGCPGDSGRGCIGLGQAYVEGTIVTRDYKRARKLLMSACNAYVYDACTQLGMLMVRGLGDPAQPTEAAKLFLLACENGSGEGCFQLGHARKEGIGTERAPLGAADDFLKSCERGYSRGCTELGYLFLEGIGVAKDVSRAKKLFDVACDSGDSNGCGALGNALLQANDLEGGTLMIRRACSMGNTTACEALHAAEVARKKRR